ncbi:PREDICTED: uncharacterized protein C3orf62 homolog [Thamnophis sirtalis]|uniref:Uncharacterized protein C3orf62 homolog n=1 Tax=Thamnophis sirtalis TaxID=35019 RepID=A0A6I9XPI9_9SAUR|nr:PREDICTED: uncharacterized protein C3orf62 homolog [Thamnophis sirtalis]
MFAPITTFYKQSDFWTISYFSLSGEMSEKLSRCRKELAAAIDRAMEDLSIPFLPSQDTSNNQDSDLPIVQLSTPHNIDIFNSKREVISPTVYGPQPSSAISSPEKENPLLRSNLFPVTVTSSITCTKREPLMSKENTWLHTPIFMADKQYFISLQDSERWKKGQVSKTDERSMKSETNLISCDVPPENPKDHEDMSAAFYALFFSVDESSAVHLGERTTFRKVLEHSPEDEAIIETLLDMEEEYRLNSSTLHQLH